MDMLSKSYAFVWGALGNLSYGYSPGDADRVGVPRPEEFRTVLG